MTVETSINDQQYAAVRALLAGNFEEHHRILDAFPNRKMGSGYWALVDAAFVLAVDKHFDEEYTLAEVVDLVADARARDEDIATALDPENAERVVLAKLGEGTTSGMDPDEVMRIESVLLVKLITADSELSASELDTFLTEARDLAEGKTE